MPVSRMRMRPWLESMIESKCISGLTWVDQEKTMFSIPWKHAARHGWEMDKDACLFKKWAIHTGKYTEGQTCDPKTWKANFRCAMNSLPDIEEVKHRSVNKGQQAMRIFKMLPVSGKTRDRRRKTKSKLNKKQHSTSKMEEDTDYSSSHSPQSTCSSEEPAYRLNTESFKRDPSEGEQWSQDIEYDSDEIASIGLDLLGPYSNRFQLSPAHEFADFEHNSQSIIESILHPQSMADALHTVSLEPLELSLASLLTEPSSSDETDDSSYTVLDNVHPSLKPWDILSAL